MLNMQVTRSNAQGTGDTKRLRLLLVAAEHVERIGTRIRGRREDLKLSRRALANKMQGVVSENDIYRWERGQHRPGDDKLEELALALEVDVSYFMVPEPLPGTPDLLGTMAGERSQLDHIQALLEEALGYLRPATDAAGDAVERLVSGAERDARSRAAGSTPGGNAAPSRRSPAAPQKARAPKKRTA